MGAFASMQAAYAQHGVPTYPLTATKVPAISNYGRVGLRASRELAQRFADSDAFGFVAGARSRLTIVDLDSRDEALAREVESWCGATPLHVLTPSGRHLYFRHSGERRQIRPIPYVDVLGTGPVVGIGSLVTKGEYRIQQGSFEDIARLPALSRRLDDFQVPTRPQAVRTGERNSQLWKRCMRHAPYCDSLDALLDIGRTFNEDAEPPLSHPEVVKTVTSAWSYEERGENRFGRGPGVFLSRTEFVALWPHGTHVVGLLVQLKTINGPDAEFWIADGWHRNLGWTIERLRAARRALLKLGYIVCVSKPRRGHPAHYRWTGHRLQ